MVMGMDLEMVSAKEWVSARELGLGWALVHAWVSGSE
jgi:hypothetical protein